MSVSAASVELQNQENVKLKCACGSSDLTNLGACRKPGIGHRGTALEKSLNDEMRPGNLYRCNQCHLGLRLPRPDERQLQTLYENLPTTRWQSGPVVGSAQQYLIKLFQHQEGLHVLDVGAFDGSFLNALPNSFRKSAIEPSEAAASLKKMSVNVLKPFLSVPTAEEAGSFDVVTMFDVFEHLTDPLQGMAHLMAYLKPGGSLYVGTGNLDHWSWRLNSGGHWYLDPIQHIVFGSQKHFAWQAQRLNAVSYRTLCCSHQAGTLRQRWMQAMTAFYFGSRGKPGWRKLVTRIMNLFSTFHAMSHKGAMPYTQQLSDHILAEFVRAKASV